MVFDKDLRFMVGNAISVPVVATLFGVLFGAVARENTTDEGVVELTPEPEFFGLSTGKTFPTMTATWDQLPGTGGRCKLQPRRNKSSQRMAAVLSPTSAKRHNDR